MVRALRAMPVGDHRFTGRGRGGDLRDHDGVVTEHLARSGDLVDVAAVARVWAEVRDTPHDVGDDRWTHGDLMPGNLLTDGRRLTAVLDVGGLGVADPALDLMPAWNLFGRTGRAGFRAALDVDDAQWARGRGWALVQAVACLDYYVATNPVMSAIAHRTLTALITS